MKCNGPELSLCSGSAWIESRQAERPLRHRRRQRCRANIADAKEPKQYWAYAGGRKMGKMVVSLASGRLFDWKTHQSSEKFPHFTSYRRSHLHSPNICLGVVCSFLLLQSHLEIWQCAWAGEIILSVMQLRQERREHEG